MSENVVVVGSYCDSGDGAGSGSVYVYRWNAGSYSETKLTPSDAASAKYFGKSVAVSGDYIVVGGSGDSDNGMASGAVYAYKWNESSYDEYKIVAEDGNALDFFGKSVDIDGDYIVVGSYWR